MPIEMMDATYTYMPGTPFERTALKHVSLTIPEGSFMAIAGHTGSGKSTLVQHLNGLLHPTEGRVLVDGIDLAKGNRRAVREARQNVGMVFQYPEHQLFEETVAEDIAFGPRNLGLSEDEVQKRVEEAMGFVDLDYGTYKGLSPFQLSGGQRRRAAIAGIIAMRPKYLVLDEPTAGLDPRGRENLLAKIVKIHEKNRVSVVLVSHNMDDIAKIADDVVVMEQGSIVLHDVPERAFFAREKLQKAGLSAPQIVTLLEDLRVGGLDVDPAAFCLEDGVRHILDALKGRPSC